MPLLISVLMTPPVAASLSLRDWDLLIRQARHANLLGRLHHALDENGVLPDVPERPLKHLVSASTMAERQHRSVRFEADLLHDTLASRKIPLILLKGAAYVLADLPAAAGRVFADIDILVPHTCLGDAESALMQTGWVSTALDAYDQRYYRRWMHELPAMQHMFRGTTLDVHHSILPPTAGIGIDPQGLIDESIELPGRSGVRVLAPIDMVLHSAAHLFHEGEADNLLRDLSDLDLLLRHFASEAFWSRLTGRARQFGLMPVLRLAVRHTHRVFATPIPPGIMDELRANDVDGLPQRLLDAMYRQVLQPQHASTADAWTPAARKLLYLRAHWLRMPPHLLAYHLGHKALFPPKTPTVQLADQRQER